MLRSHRLAVLLLLGSSIHLAQAEDATTTSANQITDPRRPAAIQTTGVPVVPADLFERLQQYQNIRTATFSGWAPDGFGMLIETRFGNTNQVHRVYEPGGRREQITFFDEPTSGRFIPQAKDGGLLLVNNRGGDENFQISYLNRDTGLATLLTDGKSRNELGPLREDGTQMIYHSNRRNGRDTDIYIAGTRTPDDSKLLLETAGEFWVANDWSADGKQLLVLHYVSINQSSLALLDVASRKLTPIAPPSDARAADGKISFGLGKFSPDGKAAYVTCDAPGEFHQLAKLDLATGKYQWLTADIPWDVDAVEVDRRSGRVAFTTNQDGASRLYLLEGDQRRELTTPLGVIAGLEFSRDGKQLGFTLARPTAPSDAYSLDLTSGSKESGGLTRWTYSEVGGLNPDRFIEPTLIQFKSFDGLTVPAYFFKPPHASAEKPAAVVVSIHGGPEGQYRPIFAGTTQFLAREMGIAVIAPNVRGSAGYGKTYLKLDNAERRQDSVQDIGALLDWIATQPELDESRIAVEGGSYGGFMVLATLCTYPERIKAGIDIVGIANFITFLENTSPYRQDLRRAEYGDERDPAMRKVFEQINPTSNVHKIRSKLMVVHGTNDPRVPFSEAQQIADKVKAGGGDVWTLYADNEGHGFRKKDNRDYLTAAQMLFLQEHLLGK
jgi:dipeptidyl aminopeptidase/acylaminoacyl peptidase